MLSHVLESEQRRAEASHRAHHAEKKSLADPLTGLYNRRGWDRRLAAEASRALRYDHPACVLAVDIDGLKQVNDLQDGHAAGDAVLRRAADALCVALRDQDLVARVGGDEFLILGVACDADGGLGLRERVTTALTPSQGRRLGRSGPAPTGRNAGRYGRARRRRRCTRTSSSQIERLIRVTRHGAISQSR